MGSRLLPLLRLLDRLLQVLIPPDPRGVAWISEPDYIGNSYHLYRHVLATRRGLEHAWLITDREAGRRIAADFVRFGGPERGHRLHVVPRHSLAGYRAYLRSRWVFHAHGVYRWVASAVRRDCVSLWHGMPIKAIGAMNTVSPNPHPTFGTLHLATSDFYRYVIAAVFRARADEVLLTGLPRCDVLHEPHPLAPGPQEVRTALGLPPDRRLVLWMPTYRSPRRGDAPPGVVGFQTFLDDLAPEQWQQVEDQAARAGCTVIVKPHPYDPLNEVDHELDLEHVRLVRSPEWLAMGIELYDALAVADGLISDISSVLVDWLTTSRPLGMVGFDPETYTRELLFDLEPLATSSRIHDLSDEAELDAFFDRVATGTPVPAEDDDLSRWLYRPDLTDGCERVLGAVGLARQA